MTPIDGAALALLLRLAASGADAVPSQRPLLAAYRLEEKVSTSGPSGPRVLARAATVRVVSGAARLDVLEGALPRSSVKTVFSSPQGLVFVDPDTKSSADGDGARLDALWRGAPADSGPASADTAVETVRVERDGPGPPFQGRPTARWRLAAVWTVSVGLPGRAARVRGELSGVIVAAEGLDAARSPFDSLTRLLPARGEVETRLVEALVPVRGLVVAASFEMRSTRSLSVNVLAAPGVAPEEEPTSSTSRAERRVSELSLREAGAGDAASLRPPEDLRRIPFERLAPDAFGPLR